MSHESSSPSSQHDFEQFLGPALAAAQHHTCYVVEKVRQKHEAACEKVRREANAPRPVQASEAAVNDALALMEQAGLRSLEPDFLRDVCEELAEPIAPRLLTTPEWSHAFPGDR